MKYSDILPDVLAGKEVRPRFGRMWVRMNGEGRFVSEDDNYVDVLREEYLHDTWEVKPEQKEIYCRNNGVCSDLETKSFKECDKLTATHKLVPLENSDIPNHGNLAGIEDRSHELQFNDRMDDEEQPEIFSTGGEYWNKRFYDGFVHDDYEHYVKTAFNVGDQNGQLKQWINHKPLREAVKVFFEKRKNKLQGHVGDIERAFKNLKPLNKE